MMIFERMRYHLPRLRHSLGQPLILGERQYRLRGYHPDSLARNFDDEPHMIPVLKRVFQERSGVVLDIGANCGQTLVKVLAIDPQRTYFGFEPQLECCFYIEHFIRSNSLNNARIIPVAMSDSNGMVELFWDGPRDLTASILPTHAHSADEKRPHSSWVPSRRGEEMVRELGISEIAAIKIDVEGFELEVLSGLGTILSDYQPTLIFEVLTNHFWGELIEDETTRREKQGRADAIFALLTGRGYSIFRVDKTGTEHPIDRFELDVKPQPVFNDGRDYIARYRKD